MIMINDHKDIDALIRAAAIHPTEQIRDKLIDMHVDNHGNAISPQLSNHLWHCLIPDDTKQN